MQNSYNLNGRETTIDKYSLKKCVFDVDVCILFKHLSVAPDGKTKEKSEINKWCDGVCVCGIDE